MRTPVIFLIGIVVIASFLRLYRLSAVPPGVNRDEASIGYTAYSLMRTGNDEYGRRFPLSFESFGDWKLPLYMYTTIPFVKLFGMNELAVRLSSALSGILSVAALYVLARTIFASETTALLAAAILSVMPWHLHISRVESEAIVATLFVILGSLFFLRKHLIPAAILFAATYWTYHGTHVSTTLLLLGMAGIFWKDILRVPQWRIATLIAAMLTVGILSVTIPADRTKLNGISIFGDPTAVHANIELPRLATGHPDAILTRLRYNRITYAIKTVTENYLASYGPAFLFIRGGGNSAHNIQGYGNLHPIEAPLLILGIIWLLKNRKRNAMRFVLWWLMIGAGAAAITKDAPHSNRMLMIVPALAMTAAAGISFLGTMLSKHLRTAAYILVAAGYLFFLSSYLTRYFVRFPRDEAVHWGYAYARLTPILFSPAYQTYEVIMTRPETSPYIYLLFYGGYDPLQYQHEAKRYPISPDGFTDVSEFGRFSFRAIDWTRDLRRNRTLLVTTPDELPDGIRAHIIATVTLPDATPQFIVIDTTK